LPSYDLLEEKYHVARATVLYAIRQLKEAGLIESRGRGGLFVAARPPHLYRQALVIPDYYDDSNLYQSAFLREIAEVEQLTGCSFEVFTRVRSQPGNVSYLRLLEEHARGRLGGIFFVSDPTEYIDPVGSPILTDPVLPRVAVTHQSIPNMVCYNFGRGQLVGVGAALLAEQGVSRLGIIGWGWYDDLPDPRQLALAACPNLRCDESWRLLIQGHQRFDVVRQVTRLLLDGNPAERPDGLLVMDDHLVGPVGLGVVDAGRAGSIRVAAFGALPPVATCSVPVSWFGWRPREILLAAVADGATRRAGGDLPQQRAFPILPYEPSAALVG
jgi:hypothetical protein